MNNLFKKIGAFALVGIGALGMASCSAPKFIKNWINGDSDTDKPSDEDTNKDTPIIDGVESNVEDLNNICFPQSIVHRSNAVNNVMTLSVDVTPSTAVNQTLSWTLEWANSGSLNVTDYVSLVVAGDTHSATLTCKKAYSSQIILKVKTTDGTNIEKSCTLDYLDRDLTVNFDLQSFDLTDMSDYTCQRILDEFGYRVYDTSGGSIRPTRYEVTSFKLGFDVDGACLDLLSNSSSNFIDAIMSTKYFQGSVGEVLAEIVDIGVVCYSYTYKLYYGDTMYLSTTEYSDDYQVMWNFDSYLKISDIELNTGDVIF